MKKYIPYDEYKRREKLFLISTVVVLLAITIPFAIMMITVSILVIASWIMLMTAFGFVYYSVRSIFKGEIIPNAK